MVLSNYIETDKDFYRKLVTIALPVAMQSVITTGVNLMDTIMLGQLGEEALSASSLGNQFINLFVFLCMGISMGASVLTSRFWGAKDHVSLKKAITIALRCGLLLALAFTVANIAAPEQILGFYSNERPVILAGAEYLRWSSITFVLMGLTTISTNIMRSVDLSKIPFVASIVAFAVNVVANYMFIFGRLGAPAMGVAGAALGTVIARMVETGIICGYFFFVDRSVKYRLKDILKPCRELVWEFLRISVPVMLSDGLLGIGESTLAMVMGHIGSQFVSANAINMVVQQVSTFFITGVAFASCFIVGQTLGKGETKTAKRQGWTFLLIGFAIGIFASGLIFLIRTPVIHAYNITTETRNIAYQLMDAVSIIVIFRASNSILTKGVLRGGGDTRFLLVADTATMWILAVPLGWLGGLVWHLSPFWVLICLHSDHIVKAIWCVFRLKSGKWIKKIQGAA